MVFNISMLDGRRDHAALILRLRWRPALVEIIQECTRALLSILSAVPPRLFAALCLRVSLENIDEVGPLESAVFNDGAQSDVGDFIE